MITFFTIVLLLTPIVMIVELMKPSVFERIIKKVPTRKQILFSSLGVLVASIVGVGVLAPPVEKQPVKEPQSTVESAPSVVNETSEDQQAEAQVQDLQSNTVATAPVPPTTRASSTSPVTSTPTPTEKTSDATVYYSVASVVDGDTFKVTIDGKTETLRLIGLDTSETVDPRKPVQCFGVEASNRAKALLTGKKVKLEGDSTQGERDKYGRLLRYAWLEDGTFFNKQMIADGYAYEYTYNSPYKYQAEFKQAQKDAQAGNKGLWSPDTCNGTTTSTNTTSTGTTSTSSGTSTTASQPTATYNYYTSAASSATKYYTASCDGWKSLSPSNLRGFNTLEELLSVYPNRTLSSQCN